MSRSTRYRYIVIFILLAGFPAVAQNTKPAPCAEPEFHQFDFWVGEWKASWPASESSGMKAGQGKNSIKAALDNCVVIENFDGTPSISLQGTSVSIFNRRTQKWQQTWVDNEGSYLDFEGEFKNGQMVLTREATARDGKKFLQRMVWKNITADAFDWSWERSNDGGKTWKVVWPIHYVRKQRLVVPPIPPEAAQFDFLLGTWDVEVAPNIPNVPGKLHGRWTARKAADGYMVADEYRAFDDEGNTVYLGETYRVYNPQKKLWEFRYAEPYHGLWYEGTGQKEGTEMHLLQKGPPDSSGVRPLLKIRIYNISADHFSWSSQKSSDGGKTWTLGATIEATRVN